MAQAAYSLPTSRRLAAPRVVAPRAALANTIACATIVVGFFLPWLHGDGAFALRSFSGLGFAVLAHNAAVATDATGLRGLMPLLLYLVPASAASAGVLSLAAGWCALPLRLERLALGGTGAYALLVLTGLLAISVLPSTSVAAAFGAPALSVAPVVLAAAFLLVAALRPRR